jgi:hypothetical protein
VRKVKDFSDRVGAPPEDDVRHSKANREGIVGVGQWGSLLLYCYEHPGVWVRSHPLPTKRRATQWASDIRREYKPEQLKRLRARYGEGGKWEAEFGTHQDHNDLLHWVVWARWNRRDVHKKNRTKHRRRSEDTSEE